MAGTITATQTGNTTGAGFLQVLVLDNAAVAATPATAVAYVPGTTPFQVTLAPTQTGSRLFGAICEGNLQVAPTPLANTTIYSSYDDTTDTNEYSAFLTAAATTSGQVGTGQVIGSSTSGGSSGAGVAAMEVLSSGGTLTVDGSTPAAVGNATNVQTTASFSPPPGAVLLAVIVTNGNATGPPTITITGTGTLAGLTWTQGVNGNALVAGSYQAFGVWYATVPPAPVPPPPPVPLPLLGPGWFPGADRLAAEPGGIPFWQQPIATDATPAPLPPVPFPPSLPYQAPLLPPGWFPGCDVTAGVALPGGIPFYVIPQPPDPSEGIPVAPPPPPYPPYTPVAPYWFPGASALTAAPDGIPFWIQPQPDSSPPLPPAALPPAIAGLGSNGQYFADQNGNPRLALFDNPWALVFNAGQWNGGNWQADMSAYLAARAAQGFTALYLSALGNTDNGGSFQNGNTWDGVTPFVSGINPSSGLNPAYWQRVDYLISAAALYGLTVFLNIAYTQNVGGGNFSTGGALYNLTQQQYTDYGTAVGNRYRSSPNLVWVYGNDYFSGLFDTQFGYIRSAIIATGDTHAMSVHVYPESTCRYDIQTGLGGGGSGSAFAVSNAQFNWVYTYNVTYWGVELAYEEAAYYSVPQLPAIWGDGYFYDAGASLPTDQMMRQFAWWAVSSGARGLNTGSNDIEFWGSGSLAAVTTGLWYTTEAGILAAALQALPGWHTLMPDTASTLVTAGRGTHGSGIAAGTNYAGGTDNYVTASVTPGGTLAVIYCAKAFSITINQSVMVPGYTATWLDPTSGATTTATPGSTYNSGALGNNSQGEPDWVLILQGQPAPPLSPGIPDWLPLPPGWFPGADAVTAIPGGVPFQAILQPTGQNAPASGTVTITGTASGAAAGTVTALAVQDAGTATTAAGAGSATAAGTVISPAAAAGGGAASAVATQIAPAGSAGAGAVADVVTQAATGTAASAGATSAVVTQIAQASAAGAGTQTATAVQAATGAAAGAGAVADVVTQIATAAAAGAGSVTAAGLAGGSGTASIAGAGATTAVVTQIAPATSAGAGAVTTAATQAPTATAAGAGSATAVATQIAGGAGAGAGAVTALAAQIAPATAAGAGAVADVVTQIATASAAGAGSVTATGGAPGSGTASIAGAGAATAVATQAATAAAAGAGAVTTTATQAAKATAAGAGAVSAAGFIIGTASVAGAGAATAAAVQAATAAPAGAGVLAALATQQAAAVIAGAGTATGAGTIQLAFTVGTLTSATAPGGAGGTLTASDQRTGGPA